MEINPSGKVAVVGSRGFIGAALVDALAKAGEPVAPVSSREVNLLARDASKKLAAYLCGAQVVVFCSAITPDKLSGGDATSANLGMAEALVEPGAVRDARVVYLSSDAVYPFDDGRIDETTPAGPESPYGAMHARREGLFREAFRDNLLIVRISQVYGANDTHNAYGPCRMARQALSEGRIALFGDGEEHRDHIDIRDTAILLQRLITQRESGIVNLVSGYSRSFAEIADIVRGHVPGALIYRETRRIPVKHRYFNAERLHGLVPDFRPRTPEVGIPEMIESIRAPAS